jgi:hypothetical protein
LDRSYEKLSIKHREEEKKILKTIKGRTTNWIGHILHRTCMLRQIIARKIEGRSERKTRKKT